MAKTLLLISFYSIVSSLLLVVGVAGKPNGLTLTLIHPDSPELPLFQANLPYEERIRRLIQQSNARDHYLSTMSSSSTESVDPEIVRPRIETQSFNYLIKCGIGTFNSSPPYKEYYLEMDTASSLTWTQCEGCTNCFKQKPKPFPKSKSKSFRPLFSRGKNIAYSERYADNTYTSGILAKENFYFDSDSDSNSNISKIEKVENITFGCGLNNSKRYGYTKNNKVAGVMGLGWGPDSFVDQIGSQTHGNFSYCLPLVNQPTAAGKQRPRIYMTFGADIPPWGDFSVTALQRNKNQPLYYLEMEGISLATQRLNISPTVFALGPDGKTGGCTIDSGMGYSRLVKPAYDVLVAALEKRFSFERGLRRYRSNPLGLGLCYEPAKAQGYLYLPMIDFHFKGTRANLHLVPEATFIVVDKKNAIRKREYFCLAVVPDNVKTSIGAYQQRNQRFIYDTKRKQLLFTMEDCLVI